MKAWGERKVNRANFLQRHFQNFGFAVSELAKLRFEALPFPAKARTEVREKDGGWFE